MGSFLPHRHKTQQLQIYIVILSHFIIIYAMTFVYPDGSDLSQDGSAALQNTQGVTVYSMGLLYSHQISNLHRILDHSARQRSPSPHHRSMTRRNEAILGSHAGQTLYQDTLLQRSALFFFFTSAVQDFKSKEFIFNGGAKCSVKTKKSIL